MYERPPARDRLPYRREWIRPPPAPEPERPGLLRQLFEVLRSLLLWALAVAPLIYVLLPLRTHTEVLIEARDQTGAPIPMGTAFLLDGLGETLDSASLERDQTATETYDEPAGVRVVAEGCREAHESVTSQAACEAPALAFSDLPSFLKHGSATYFARRCQVRAELDCGRRAAR